MCISSINKKTYIDQDARRNREKKKNCNLSCFLEGTNKTKNNHVDEDIRIVFQFYVYLTKHALIVAVNKSQAKCGFNPRTLSIR